MPSISNRNLSKNFKLIVRLNTQHQICESSELKVYTKERKFEAYISNIHHTKKHQDISKIGKTTPITSFEFRMQNSRSPITTSWKLTNLCNKKPCIYKYTNMHQKATTYNKFKWQSCIYKTRFEHKYCSCHLAKLKGCH